MPIGNPIQKNNDTRVISATATTGQTDFTVTGGYTINAIGVFRNGVRLNNSTDFTAADGSTVSLNVAADAGDTVTFHIFDKFTVANAIVGAASTQTVYGNLAVNGELYSTNLNPTNVDIVGIATIAKAIIGTGVTIDQSNIDTVGLISATTFTGNLTGDVTGDVTGGISGGTVAGSTATFSGSGSFSGDLDIAADIRHIGDTNTKISFSSADTIQLTTGGTARVQVDDSATTLNSDVSIADKIIHTGDTNTAIRFPAADTFSVETGGSERLRVASDGKVGIGSDSPQDALDVAAAIPQIRLHDTSDGSYGQIRANGGNLILRADEGNTIGSSIINFEIDGDEHARITSAGKVGIGTDNPGTVAHLLASDCYLTMQASSASGNGGILFKDSGGTQNSVILYDFDNDYLKLTTNADTESLRIDSSQRLLVGTAAGRSAGGVTAQLQVEGTSYDTSSFNLILNANDANPAYISLSKSRGTSDGSSTVVQDGDYLGLIQFCGADGTDINSRAAEIFTQVDGSPGSNDLPGRLIFGTTADGASSPTERLRIDSSGRVIITNDSVTNPTGTNTQYASLVVRGNTSATSSRAGWLNLARSEASANIGSGEGIGEIYFGDQQAGEYAAIKCFADAAAAVGDYPGRLSFWTTADGGTSMSEKLRINSSGRTLIGAGAIAATSFKVAQGGLQVSTNGASGAPTLNLGADGSAANTQTITDNTAKDFRMGFPNYDIDEEPLASMLGFVGAGTSLQGTDCARIHLGGGTSYLNAVNQIRFYTTSGNQNTVTGTERVRITHDGDIQFHRTAYEAGTVEQKINYYSDAGTAGSAVMGKNCEIALVKKDSWDTTWTSYGEIVFRVNGDSRYALDEAARFTYGGDLKFTTGNGITFDDSATSATLDDYEEGTFTPSWVGTSNHGTTSYGTSNTAGYTKIGNMVHCRGYSQISGNSGGTGYWIIDNLPFASPAGHADITTGSCMMENFNFPNNALWVVPYKPASNDNMYLYYSQDAAVWDALELSDDTAFYIIWSLSYEAA